MLLGQYINIFFSHEARCELTPPGCSPEPFICRHTFAFTRFTLSLGPSFPPCGPSPQHPLRLDLCHMSWKAFPESHLPPLVLVTCPPRVSLATLILTHVAAFTVGFQRLHTCDAKFCKLLDSRDWVISIACKAQNLSYHSLLDGWVDG